MKQRRFELPTFSHGNHPPGWPPGRVSGQFTGCIHLVSFDLSQGANLK